MPITTLATADLAHVIGGASTGKTNTTPSAAALHGALENPSARMTGGVTNPGGKVWENGHGGPSASERISTAFDKSTRAMSTFNEIMGAKTQRPGFGNGGALEP